MNESDINWSEYLVGSDRLVWETSVSLANNSRSSLIVIYILHKEWCWVQMNVWSLSYTNLVYMYACFLFAQKSILLWKLPWKWLIIAGYVSPQASSSKQRPHKCNTKGGTSSNQGGYLAHKLIVHHLREVMLEANNDAYHMRIENTLWMMSNLILQDISSSHK